MLVIDIIFTLFSLHYSLHIILSSSFLFLTGQYFAEVEIPVEFTSIWRYMYHMYQLDAFTQSCPADQDIINHYKLQQGTKMKKHEELEMPTFTASIPTLIEVNNSNHHSE